MYTRLLPLLLTALLAGCDLEALLADPKVAQREADARAIGSACRHGLRPIEDCYALNPKAPKAAVFSGWKEMDQYMRDNKMEGSAPTGIKSPSPMVPADEVIVEKEDPKADAKAKGKPH